MDGWVVFGMVDVLVSEIGRVTDTSVSRTDVMERRVFFWSSFWVVILNEFLAMVTDSTGRMPLQC